MRQRPRLAFAYLLALISVASASRAHAVCTLSACDAAPLIASAQCCSASSCTIDGTLTVSAATCSFDFGTRNLTVSGQVAAQGKTIALQAKSVKLTGLIDVRGPSGSSAGQVTITTTGMTAVAYSQEGGLSAVIDASSSAGAGGRVFIHGDGAVMLTKGSINASGGPGSVGGFVELSTTSGDVSVQIPVTATGGIPPIFGQIAGAITFSTPGNLSIGGGGRLIADLGAIGGVAAGTASIAAGGFLQANGGGDITVVAGTLSSLGEFRASGDFGTVDLTASDGPLFLSLPTQGITVGPGGGVSLTTDSAGVDGAITVDMPILANGAAVEISSAGSIVVSRKIETTGILDSGAGEITLEAAGDVHVIRAIVSNDLYSVEDVSIEAGGDVLIEGNIELKGDFESDGGNLGIIATGTLTVQGDVAFNVSGADTTSAGSIDLQSGGDMTIGSSVELIADGSPVGAGGSIDLQAGVDGVGATRLPGNLTLQGDIKANGHSTSPNHVTLHGCNVQVPDGAVIDITGDTGSLNTITARTGLTIAGQLKASGANVLEFGQGATVSLTGTFTPARSAGACTNGTVTANGCQRPMCTADNVPALCLYPCPACGDSVTTFPETCEIGGGGPFCTGSQFCDASCRQRNCVDQNPCTVESCDQSQGCLVALQPNGSSCSDNNICDGVEACQNGNCVVAPGTVPPCGSDGNPCTTDGCDPIQGCFHDPLAGPGIAGCDDANPCTGTETCVAGTCQAGTLVSCPVGQTCNPANGTCEGAAPCDDAGDCFDNNPCTDDVCAGTCSNPLKTNGTSCDDGDMCNGLRTCTGGVCQPPTSPVVCNDNDVCTIDACNPLTGLCGVQPITGCCNTAGDCNDADACTTDACTDNACTHGTITCNDANACTTDSCNPADGCHYDPIPSCQACASLATCSDDADVCTDKACLDGRCQQVSNPNCCNGNEECADIDSNPCTNNGPCTANRCEGPFPLDATACGTPCNPATCHTGTCVLDAPMDCNDSNLCTNDVCTDDQGCTHPAIGGCCTGAGQCADQNVCTVDGCDLDANACSNDVPDETCTPCAGGDPFECGPRCSTVCDAGRCQDVVADCNDDNPCTADACDPVTGCGNTPLDGTGVAGCDDGQACNGAETCTAGTCNQQPSPECDDDDACTDDSCNDASGCSNVQKTGNASIFCRLDAMTDAINGAAADAIKAKLRKKTLKKLAKLRTKVETASAPSTKCKKSKSILTAGAKQLRGMQRSFTKLSGRQLDAALAASLADLAGSGAGKIDDARAGLGC